MPAPAPQGGQNDNSAGMLWGVAALFAAIGVIWWVFKTQLVKFYLSIKLFEAQLLSYLADHFNVKSGYYDLITASVASARTNAENVTFEQLMMYGNAVGTTLRWPFVIMCVILAIVVYFGSSTRVYKRAYGMKDLAKLEKTNWPQITPVVNMDLLKTDIDVGPWAMAMTPMQFCKRYRLLDEYRPQRVEGMARKDWDRIDVVLKRGEANKIFALQLGPAWRGTKNLPPHTRALFAIFAARINADSAAAAKIIDQLNRSAPQLDMTGVEALIMKHERTKEVQQITSSYAYVSTVMAAMLSAARSDGVQASADFLWLKPIDRKLWYTLNTVGRQTPFIEVAGIFAHWIAEREAGRKLTVPMIEEATNAVETALKEVVYKRDEA